MGRFKKTTSLIEARHIGAFEVLPPETRAAPSRLKSTCIIRCSQISFSKPQPASLSVLERSTGGAHFAKTFGQIEENPMNSSKTRPRLFVSAVTPFALALLCGCPNQASLTAEVNALKAQVADLEAKLAHVSVEEGSINGVNGPHFIFEGCNVHVRSGSGDTPDSAGLTGLGNLFVGYNELPFTSTYGRLGSHNLVVGMEHEYASYAGFIAGQTNAVTAESASVSGGTFNLAGGNMASVTGGSGNDATGSLSSVSGGGNNVADASFSSVSGGVSNMATGTQSHVCGGESNEASGVSASVSGGGSNLASGNASSISGGDSNIASGQRSSVSGGGTNTASGSESSVSGGDTNTASGANATVSGGEGRSATDIDDWVAGGLFQTS